MFNELFSDALSDDTFSGDAQKDPAETPPPEVNERLGLSSISLLPEAEAELGKSVVEASAAPASMSDLLAESDGFDLDDWMAGFDPDADFGGLGFDPVSGPGTVNVGVRDTDGDNISGVVVTEDGFRTDMKTGGDGRLIISNIPYGERVYGIYLPYSFEFESVDMVKHVKVDDGSAKIVQVKITDFNDIPPVEITDDTADWEITFILRQYMRIKASYFLVSPNDRFYLLRYDDLETKNGEPNASESGEPNAPDSGEPNAPDNREPDISFADNGLETGSADNEPETGSAEEPDKVAEASAYYSYRVNTFERAPVRIAVYIEMPALKGVSRIIIEGEGFCAAAPADKTGTAIAAEANGATGAIYENRAADETDMSAASLSTGAEDAAPPWHIEDNAEEFSLPDLTVADSACQLVAYDSNINADDATFIRYFILSIPEAYEGLTMKFNKIRLFMNDGEELALSNPSQSDLTIHVVSAPKLL